MILEKIKKENDIKELSEEELEILADEIREFLIQKISVTGGHLASNLGVVELTMALHLFLDLPKDKLILSLIHISEPTRRTPISYAVFCLKKKKISMEIFSCPFSSH